MCVGAGKAGLFEYSDKSGRRLDAPGVGALPIAGLAGVACARGLAGAFAGARLGQAVSKELKLR